MFTHDELDRIHRAVAHARDTAFVSTGDKSHRYVKGWEELMARVDAERAALKEGVRD